MRKPLKLLKQCSSSKEWHFLHLDLSDRQYHGTMHLFRNIYTAYLQPSFFQQHLTDSVTKQQYVTPARETSGDNQPAEILCCRHLCAGLKNIMSNTTSIQLQCCQLIWDEPSRPNRSKSDPCRNVALVLEKWWWFSAFTEVLYNCPFNFNRTKILLSASLQLPWNITCSQEAELSLVCLAYYGETGLLNQESMCSKLLKIN